MAVIGIDFGSTNTCAAVFYEGRVRMIEMSAGGATSMPSVVCVVGENVVVGQEAVDQGRQYPDYDFRNFKRNLGVHLNRDEDMAFQVCEGPGGMLAYRGPAGFTYSPIELASFILGRVIDTANEFLRDEDTVTGAVLGVPATAAEYRRAHSREALEEKATTMCRPVWASAALDGVYVVVAIEDGCFMVRNLQAVGGDVGPYPYRVRDGRYARASWLQRGDAVCLARLDPVATMLAWRAFCAARKESP